MRTWLKVKTFRFLLAQPGRALAGAGAPSFQEALYAPTLGELAGNIIRWANGLGEKVKAGTLSWAVGLAETIYKKPAGAYLALLTVEWKASLTGSTFTEPGTGGTEYEGYARKKITFHEAVEGSEAEIYNTAQEEFAVITGTGAGAKIIAWGLSTELTLGTNIAGGTTTETTISKTQTPAIIAAKALKIKLA